MPETAGGGFVVSRFRGMVARVVGHASIPGEAQRVLVECGGKIAGVVGETELAGRVQVRYCDLQQQSDRSKHSTETTAGPVGLSALLLSRP
jgi:hypothetical protein